MDLFILNRRRSASMGGRPVDVRQQVLDPPRGRGPNQPCRGPSMYGKQTEYAIAAMSRLAEVYDGGKTRLSAADIADARGLQRPSVAKVLAVLSQAGLVTGSRGPGGGSALARDPKSIKLYDVFKLFERETDSDACPLGGRICRLAQPCPIHDKLVAVQRAMDRLLHQTTFDEFRLARARRRRQTRTRPKRKTTRKRGPYRATRASPHKRRAPR